MDFMNNIEIRLECLKLAQDLHFSERVNVAALYADFIISGKSGETPKRPAANNRKK